MAARLTLLLAIALMGGGATVAAQSPVPPRLVFEVEGQLPARPAALPAAVRVVVAADASPSTLGATTPSGDWPVWLTITGVDAETVNLQDWSDRIRILLDAVPTLAAVELQADGLDVRRASFLLRVAAVEVRSRDRAVPVFLGGPVARPPLRDAIASADLLPLIDGLSLDDEGDVTATATWLAERDPGATVALLGIALPAAEPARAWLHDVLPALGGSVTTRGYRLDARALGAVLPVALRIGDLLAGTLVPVSEPGSVTLRIADAPAPSSWRPRVLYDLTTLASHLIVESPERAASTIDLSVVVPAAGAVVVREPLTGQDRPAARVIRDDVLQRTEATVAIPGGGPWVIDLTRGAEAAFVAQEDVRAARTPTVEEILARHQARQAAERTHSPRYVVDGRIQQYFRPTVTDPGFDVITENRFFVDRVEGTEWEERTFSVNGATFGEPRPPFPLLQPEKVLAPPLAIELDARYRYRLQGTDSVQGRSAWVVAFEPQRKDQSLYRGTVWIDRETYARLRQQVTQTALTAPVISNAETQDFAPVTTPAGEVWLPARLYNQQLILIAGRTLLVERRVTFSDYAIDPRDFTAQRQEARDGSRTMYRDTDAGVRYLVKEGDQRVVSDVATTRAKAMALGVTIDPGFEFPLPIGGINYLNFRFRGRPDTQVAVLFAGVLAAGNIQRPRAIAGRIDASLDFFAIAPPSSDRVFGPGGERDDQQLLTWPLSTGLNLGWQATPFQRISGQYLFRFDGFVRDRTTAPDYVTPSTTVTNGVGLLYEYRRGGYSLTANGTWWRRASWRPWGEPDALTATPASYRKYQASATKVFYVGPFSKVVVNGAWFSGDRLDRFSQYQFGLFDDTRIHGVPAAGVRYGELAMARAQYSFNLFEQYRTDVFLDRGWGRIRPRGVPGVFEVPWEPITGVGVAFNLRIPGRTAFLRGEVGYAWLPDRYRGLGSTTVQIMLLRPL